MASDGPFVHAWVLPAILDPESWLRLQPELVRVIRGASVVLEQGRGDTALATLRGPNGLGHLVIQPDAVAFNGNAFLGMAGDAFSVERVASSGILSRRASRGDARAVRRCATGGHPYDLAVCGALIVLLAELGSQVRVGTSGTLRTGWGRAAGLVRAVTSHAGTLVQQESGLLRWVNEQPAGSRASQSSA